MPELLTFEKRDGITVIGLNEPDRRNAFSIPMRTELAAAMRAEIGDEACRAIVLTGNGGVFSAGGDIRAMGDGDPQKWAFRMEILHAIARSIAAGVKPVVAAVEGMAFGAGMSIAALCDYVVAAEDAKFCASFGRMALVGDTGALWSLPQRIGATQTRALMISARVVEAPEAKQLGLVDELAPRGGTREAALGHAQRLAKMPPLAFGAMKSVLARSPASLDSVLAMELDLQMKLLMSADHAAAREAFFAKKEAVFTGR